MATSTSNYLDLQKFMSHGIVSSYKETMDDEHNEVDIQYICDLDDII